MRMTTVCRLELLLLLVVLPINILWWVCSALYEAGCVFCEELNAHSRYSVGVWYRHIWRPAIYGSVHDE